jgi:hypothetical protein
MNKNLSNLLIIVCLTVFLFTVYGLLNSSQWLNYDLPGGIPLGNILTSISLVAIAIISIICAPLKNGQLFYHVSFLY